MEEITYHAIIFIIVGIILFTVITPAWLIVLPGTNAMVKPVKELLNLPPFPN